MTSKKWRGCRWGYNGYLRVYTPEGYYWQVFRRGEPYSEWRFYGGSYLGLGWREDAVEIPALRVLLMRGPWD